MTTPTASRLRRLFDVGDRGCVECGKPERPWRRMMWYPLSGSSAGAFICSDECWEAFDARA